MADIQDLQRNVHEGDLWGGRSALATLLEDVKPHDRTCWCEPYNVSLVGYKSLLYLKKWTEQDIILQYLQ